MGTIKSMATFARRRGVSRVSVTRYKRAGLLVLTPDGLVDVAASDARLAERPAVYRGGASKSASEPKPENQGSDTTFVSIRRPGPPPKQSAIRRSRRPGCGRLRPTRRPVWWCRSPT